MLGKRTGFEGQKNTTETKNTKTENIKKFAQSAMEKYQTEHKQ